MVLLLSEAIKAFLTTSANGALILRVLQALSSFVTLSTEKENDGISRDHFEFSEISPILEPLWHELSCCISKVESYSEPAPCE
jgi:E3 ubiquitin-protein ligase HUWE1